MLREFGEDAFEELCGDAFCIRDGGAQLGSQPIRPMDAREVGEGLEGVLGLVGEGDHVASIPLSDSHSSLFLSIW